MCKICFSVLIEIGDKQYGWVQMEILNHIGNKRLENIAVVKLCASKMYQLYLDNQTISEHEINQYIPDIGRQEISEQNLLIECWHILCVLQTLVKWLRKSLR